MDFIKYIGIPYKLGGRSFEACDCYGLVYLFLLSQGYTLPLYDIGYIMDDREHLIDVNQPLLCGEQVTNPVSNSICLFYRGLHPVHMGVCTNNGILHTTESYNSVFEPLTSMYLSRYRKKEFYLIDDVYRGV